MTRLNTSNTANAPGQTQQEAPASAQLFYDRMYAGTSYAAGQNREDDSFGKELRAFIHDFNLEDSRCLEIGCGRGVYQDAVDDYVGIDISEALSEDLHKPFVIGSATNLPFPDASFDAIWSYAVLEHVCGPESALNEIRRVLKPGGLLLLHPAWQCRPWAAQGYPVRALRDLGFRGALIKLSIPLRDSVWFRAIRLIPFRLWRQLCLTLRKQPTRFHYKKLSPNYEHFWTADSDAVNSMDAHEAILWFISRGDECVSHPTSMCALRVSGGALIFRRHQIGG